MNKLLRNNLKRNHFIKRLKNFAVKFYDERWIDIFYKKRMQVYRETGTPGNCNICESYKYSKTNRQNDRKLINTELNNL